jgi:hypothetical protein
MRRLFASLVIVLWLAGPASAVTYFIGPTSCNDSNAGTNPAAPWCTLTKIKNFAVAASPGFVSGDIINVAPGTYTDKFTNPFGVLIGGSGTFGGASGNPVTLQCTGVAGSCIVDAIEDGVRSPRVEGSAGADGVCTNSPYPNQACRRHGMYLLNLAWWVIDGFTIRDAFGTGVFWDNADNIVWRNNTVEWNGWASDLPTGHSGMYIKENCATPIIRNNLHWHNGTKRQSVRGHGIYWQATGGGEFINNVMAFNQGWGLQVTPLSGFPVDGVKIFNNTMVFNGSVGTAPSGPAGVEQGAGMNFSSAGGTGLAQNNLVRNNIFAHNRLHAIRLFEASGTGNIVDNNVSFANPSADVSPNDGSGGTMSLSPVNWRRGNPNLINPAGGDFRVGAGSSAINIGTTLTEAATDAAGERRPQGAAYDIGAFEYRRSPLRNLIIGE